MAQAQQKIEHPYINATSGVCGGSAVVVGTRFPVRSVVNYVFKLGLTPEELVQKFSHLSLAQIYDALSYYYDHRQEIDREIDEDSIEACIRDFPELT
ncbi:MAG: DUF433 domain-containing protein [Deltaproteobacteria bacterium]|nr:DUF433 domain-containing protein [Deltaproteobacteria bacterium]